ncbi:hypothetical protein NQ318_002134 [Aromia moschata]|uniref:Protein quiver n=1 Tax=Aromia moschata TaxID=1265417 RepID=A0AAV8Y2N2_9CUCU|nr:hypothetical protein NQ318_002134 [Aromia moschata]
MDRRQLCYKHVILLERFWDRNLISSPRPSLISAGGGDEISSHHCLQQEWNFFLTTEFSTLGTAPRHADERAMSMAITGGLQLVPLVPRTKNRRQTSSASRRSCRDARLRRSAAHFVYQLLLYSGRSLPVVKFQPDRDMVHRVYVGVLVLFFVANVQEGHSIKCYSCSSTNNKACEKPNLNELTPVACNMQTLEETRNNAELINKSYHAIFDVALAYSVGIDLVCLKVVVKDGNKDVILRGCQLAEQRHLDICKRLEDSNTQNVRKVFCSKCNNEDGCNSSPNTRRLNVFLGLICAVACKMFSGL